MKAEPSVDHILESIGNLKCSENSPENTDFSVICNNGSNSESKQDNTQPDTYLLHVLLEPILENILQYVDQYDLCNLLLTCKQIYHLASSKLYNRITVDLDCDYPLVYENDSRRYVSECGMKYIHSSLILSKKNLIKLFLALCYNTKLIDKIKFFIFDKCFDDEIGININTFQGKIIDFFAANSKEMNFLHISFIDFESGIDRLTKFLSQENIRGKVFKLFVRNLNEFHLPSIPPCLTNLFLSLNEKDLMTIDGNPVIIDLNRAPFNVFNSLFTLTCSTKNQMGLQIVKSIKLLNDNVKLKLKGLTIFHCHNENAFLEEMLYPDFCDNDELVNFQKYIKQIPKKLNFGLLLEKFDLTYISHLYLRVDCMENKLSTCNCYEKFFRDFAKYSENHDGLPKLKSFEVESFPSFEWLTPLPILDSVIKPLGTFTKTLANVERVTIDFLTPGFKMFDNDGRQPAIYINKIDECVMEEFLLSLFDPFSNTAKNLKTLQLSDFLTSFIYYKADFFHSFLHTCQCWGCELVLKRLKRMFYPIVPNSIEDEEGNDTDLEETFYLLVGYILGKLQTDREVCIPIEDRTYQYDKYPIYKGQPHILHHGFHILLKEEDKHKGCMCDIENDPLGKSELNIDNLVTTYIIHQLRPMIEYLSKIFPNLDNLIIHGIYYGHDRTCGRFVPIFDTEAYPKDLLLSKQHEIDLGIRPSGPFGYFRKHKETIYE